LVGKLLKPDISKTSAGRAKKSFIGAITKELANGGEVALVDFGSHRVNTPATRTGRNYQTGSEIQIKAFIALKDAIMFQV